ncbi:MAG: N-acetylglucosamine-6-phosphate deacetylase [Pseudomonadota bacterium]
MKYALSGVPIYTGEVLLDDRSIIVEGSHILDVVANDKVPPDAEPIGLEGKILAPGFIDLQVNGGGGQLFNDAPTVETIEAIATAHMPFGVTGFLPTLISDDDAKIRAATTAVDAAIEAGVPGVLGIHIEGPYLNPARKGVHDATKIRAPGAETLELLTGCTKGWTLITLAPEITGAKLVRDLVENGVIVSAGHSDATYEEIEAAAAQGLCSITHLFNAMSPLQSRNPGMVGAAMALDNLFTTIIVDGHHVHPAAMRLAFAAKGPDRLCLISDAMPTVGTDVEEFELQEQRILRRDGRLDTEAGTLAGADLGMAQAMRNACTMLGAKLEDALRMASLTPARLLGLTDYRGWLAAGYRADMVLIDENDAVTGTWIGGRRIFG